MTDTHFMTVTIAVHLELNDGSPILKILDDPHIPRNTLAAIAWVASANSEPFNFVDFHWYSESTALTHPVRLGACMTAIIGNRDESEIGEWRYELAVSPLSSPGELIWSNKARETPTGTFDNLRLVLSRWTKKVTGLGSGQNHAPAPDPDSHVGTATITTRRTNVDLDTTPEFTVEAQVNSGPMIVTTRV